MGYTTQFEGVLKFEKPLTIEQLKALNEVLGEDTRDGKLAQFQLPNEKYSYLQYEVTRDMEGLKWDGNEKFYHAENALNLILRYMRNQWPDFNMIGKLLAQGEEVGDVWELRMDNGKAIKVDTPPSGQKITCPECDHTFYHGEQQG